MSCIFECPTCSHLLKTTNVAITGTAPNQVLTLTIPTTTFENLNQYCLIICQSIPAGAGTLPVEILNGTTSINLLCRKGNTLRADQIRSRRRYKMVYGSDPVHLLVESSVCSTSFSSGDDDSALKTNVTK